MLIGCLGSAVVGSTSPKRLSVAFLQVRGTGDNWLVGPRKRTWTGAKGGRARKTRDEWTKSSWERGNEDDSRKEPVKGGSCFFIGPLLATISRQSGGVGPSTTQHPCQGPTLARTAQDFFFPLKRGGPGIGSLLQT